MSALIKIDFDHPKAVVPVKYGWHYEEIGMIGDGGLYAQLVRNRDFSESGTVPGLTVKDGRYVGIPDNDMEVRHPEFLPELNAWETTDSEAVAIRRLTLDEKNRRFGMRITAHKPKHMCGVKNTGYFGIRIKPQVTYHGVIKISGKGAVDIAVADSVGYVTDIFTSPEMNQTVDTFRFDLVGQRDSKDAFLLITPLTVGEIDIYFTSLMPGDTWDDGKSIFRADILKNMKDYAPAFLRFPGGCIVHGVNVETMYHWKETIGDITARKSSWSKWQPHLMTNGLGYHEFYELCEYLGAEAMYVAPTGLICTAWAHQIGDSDDFEHPDINVEDYINDCLDAIEYALGDTDTYWGAKRAENGHSAPFPLTYLSIGNEDFGPRYYKYYDAFYRAIKEKWPAVKIVANSIIGNRSRGEWNFRRNRLKDFIDYATIEIFDEHYYDTGDWIFENFDRFDAYDRNGPDLMCLELGLADSNILYESCFLMMMEKNGELNPVFGGRPLMRNWTFVNGELNPYYYHTNDKSWKTVHYYAKKLFKDNGFTTYYPSRYYDANGSDAYNENTVFTSVGRDAQTGELIIKAVNLTDAETKVRIGLEGHHETKIWTVVNYDERPKAPEASAHDGPMFDQRVIDFTSPYTFPAKSLTVMRIAGGINQ